MLYECGTCWKNFPAGWHAWDQHCRATGHYLPDFECEECGVGSNDEDDHCDHVEAYNHFPFECSQCYETWPNEAQLQGHEMDDHLYCNECDRSFQNQNNLRMTFNTLQGLNQHLNSPVHRQNLYHCPKRGCRSDFKTLAAVINHLESETCGAVRFETVQKRVGDIVSGSRMIRF